MNFRKTICAAIVFAIVLSMMLPSVVFAAKDNSPNLPDYDHDLLYERTFDNGLCYPWHTCEDSGGKCQFQVVDVPGQSGNRAFRLTVLEPGQNKWSVQMRHRGITLEQGHTYKIKFTVWADKACRAYVKLGQLGEPYTDYWSNNWTPISIPGGGQKLNFEATFTMDKPTDDACEFAFHVGGEMAAGTPYNIYLDDVSVYDAQFTKPPVYILPEPDVRVNQVGYLPDAKKFATVVSNSTSALKWQLLDASGKVVLEGNTIPKGLDKDSQDYVHWIDFSSYKTEGTGYYFKLPTVNSDTNYSHPFDISSKIYSKMKFDALTFFYHKRSGIAIEMPYAGGEQWTRPAGHIGVAPNKGDTSVPTWPQSDEYAGIPQKSYTKDVTGGWYDAGDHGKYVVNGGIAVWTLMNMYERAKIMGLANQGAYVDGGMNIPEKSNGYPDILDEARWEIEFFMKMQVTEREDASIAGMVHHKIHDYRWTALGMLPHEDEQPRYLRPVSTAATLNFAATLAQSARLWKEFDPTFAAQCLEKAEIAWKAALKNPEIYAEYTPGSGGPGGGPYNDNYVGDEFYWAACELYVTTGKSEYKDYLMKSPHYLEMPAKMGGSNEDAGLWGCFTWGTTQGLGTITLALVENGLPSSDIQKAKSNIAKAADAWLANIEDQGYRLPIKQAESEQGGYPWGSNSFILNQMIVMGYAHDFTGNSKYVDGMQDGMSYLLGRNALDQSYVTGYGERALQNPHDRFWTPQTSKKFPAPPPGMIAGGPNSRFEDPTIIAAVNKAIPPQKCYFDHTDSWSTNEITVNWNAPFAWVTAYLDETPVGDGGDDDEIVYGDCNNDGKVTSTDYSLLKRYVLKQVSESNINVKNADVNADGRVNSTDVSILRRYVIKEIKELPYK